MLWTPDIWRASADMTLPIKEMGKTLHTVMRGKHHAFAKHNVKLVLLGQQGLPSSTHA